MKSKFSIIEAKLNDFIRKFYSNRVVVGILLFVVLTSVTIFSLFMIESFAFLSPTIKTLLFYFAIFLFLSVFIFFICIPLLKIFKLIPYLSFMEASKIISDYFSDSKDVLINVLQLNDQSSQNSEFLVASINQKIDKISPLNFTNAINLRKTSKFLFYSLGILLVLITLSLVFSKNFKQGATRFVNYSTFYQPENPYSLTLLNDTLYCASGEDFTVKARIEGPTNIQDVFVDSDNFSVRMNQDSTNYFSYSFKNISSDLKFKLKYLNFSSDDFVVSVFKKPEILNFTVQVIPPAYTNLKSEEFENTGDLIVPFGSMILWNYDVVNCHNFSFFVDTLNVEALKNNSKFEVKKTALKNFEYYFVVDGENGYSQQSNMFHVNQIPDYYPQIQVVSSVDSTASNCMYFSGRISDDYGFHSLKFVYFDPNKKENLHSETIEINKNLAQDFYFYYDFSALPKTVSYYFEVRDNDNISGYKSSKTPMSIFTSMTNAEKQSRIENLQSSMNDKINDAQHLLNELNNDLQDFQKSVSANQQMTDWEKQLKLNNLLDKQNKLQSLMNEISQENQFKDSFQNQLSPEQNLELLEKQKLLQEFWDKLLTDDLKELMDKISELSNSINEKNLRDNIQGLKFDYNKISEQLDRNNELMKMFDVENKLQGLSKDMKKLSEKTKDLAKKISDKKISDSDRKEAAEQLDEIRSDFNKQQSDYKNLKQENETLGNNKLEIPDLNQKFDEIKKQLNEEIDALDKENKFKNQSGSDKLKSGDKNFNDDESGKSREFDFGEKSEPSEVDKDDKKDSSSELDKNSKSEKSDVSQETKQKDDDFSSDFGSKSDKGDAKTGQEKERDGLEKSDVSRETSDFEKLNSVGSDKNQSDSMDESGRSDLSGRPDKIDYDKIQQKIEKTSEEMGGLSDEMEGLQKKNKEKKNQENINDIRQILDNLVVLSFAQENIVDKIKVSDKNFNVLSRDLIQLQGRVEKDFSLVRDSIFALAKRVPEVGYSVYQKIGDLKSYFTKANTALSSANKSSAMTSQQFVLTDLNDLSLIFSEIQEQMQDQQMGQSSNSQQESQQNSSKNKKEMQQRQQSMQDIKGQQRSLKSQLEQMLKQLEKGENATNQQLAQSLKMSEMLQQQLQQLKNMQGTTPDQQKLLNQMSQMLDETKRDIVNRNISRSLIDRHNSITNKLLELEKAERSQDFDDKRESKSASDYQNNNKKDLNFKFKELGSKEFLNSPSLDLNLFYQNKYSDYLLNID